MYRRLRSPPAVLQLLVQPVPIAFAVELALVMRESTRTKEAVEEWWDVNMAPLADGDADSGRALLVALMEELRPALRLARIFVRT